ncbi:MAG TPA: tetratricopeptide repeat protein [Caldimonas sp.]
MLVFTDLVDSTALSERLGDARASALWVEHDRRARELMARHDGREIDHTDGFFVLFERADPAASFARDYHAALAELALRARVGIHAGRLIERENAPQDIARGAKPLDAEGLAKAVTARVMSLARGGQTLVTTKMRDALGDSVPDGTELRSHGHYRLKGIDQPVELLELGVRGASAFQPPADVEKAYRVVRAGDAWLPLRDVRHNLPAERDAFVGRAAELRDLAALVDGGTRLVTVLGPGGMGKTRLVRRYAWTWLGEWPGGVYFCDLSDARSEAGILFAVASALEVPPGTDEPVAQLGNAIAGRDRCLVILDNFEQVAEHAATTVGRWLDRAPDATFIVTSRERLHIAGEAVFPVEPLSVQDDGIELFVMRTRAQRPDFAINEANQAAVAEVVRLLDGLPLAIELAAARARLLSPSQLVVRMRDRFALLAGARGAAARQATLRAAIDWSWELLTPWEQGALAQCSVFEGGFTLEAAETVIDLSAWPNTPPAMDVVQALSDKSFLRTWVPATQSRYDVDEPFFGMYLSIREYAADKLHALGAADSRAAEARHGRHFAGFGTEAALEGLCRAGGVKHRRVLTLELDNLVAACRRALVRGDGATAVAAYRAAWEVLALHGPYALGAALGEQVLALAGLPDSDRAPAAVTLAQALRRSGRMDEAKAWLEAALAIARTSGDAKREGRTLARLGQIDREQSRSAQAKEHFDAALAIARTVGDRMSEGDVRSSLGLLDREQGRSHQAREHFAAALAIARKTEDRVHEGVVLGSLGLLHSEAGEADAARGDLSAALAIAREVGDVGLEGTVRANLAQLASEQGDVDAARMHLTAALAIHREVGNRRLEAIALGNLGPVWLMQGQTAEAHDCYERALVISRDVGNRRHQSFLLLSRGILWHTQDRTTEARRDYEAALTLAREANDPRSEGIALSRLGQLAFEEGRFQEARALFELALSIACNAGYRRLEGVVRGAMGPVLMSEGHADEAIASVRAGEEVLREIADREELCKLLCVRGTIEMALGQVDEARAALAEAEAIARAMGSSADSQPGRDIAALRKATS